MISVREPIIAAAIDFGGREAKGLAVKLQEGSLPEIIPGSIFTTDSDVKKGPRHVTGTVIPKVLQGILNGSGVLPHQVKIFGSDYPCTVDTKGRTSVDKGNMVHAEWTGFPLGEEIDRQIRTIAGFNPEYAAEGNDGLVSMHGVSADLEERERRTLIHGYFVGTGVGGGAFFNGQNVFDNSSQQTGPGASRLLFNDKAILLGVDSEPSEFFLEELVSLLAVERKLLLLHMHDKIPNGHPLMQIEATADKPVWLRRAENVLRYACPALEEGRHDDFSMRIFQVQVEALARHLSQRIAEQKPRHIFIGGGVIDSRRVTPQFANWYVGGIERRAMELMQGANLSEKPQFHIPRHGDFVVALGAAIMAHNEWMNRQ